MLSRRFMEDLERQRDRVQNQLNALNHVLQAFADEPRGAQAHALSDEQKANISKGVKRAYARRNRRGTRLPWPERKQVVVDILRRGPACLPDIRKETGFFETLTRNTLERLVEEGTAVKGSERDGPKGSFLYALTGRGGRETQERQVAQAALR